MPDQHPMAADVDPAYGGEMAYGDPTPCTHWDERGSTVMAATADRYECIVCGQRFRLVPSEAAIHESRAGGGLDRLDDAATEYINAVTAYLEPENQYTESRRHAMHTALAELIGAIQEQRGGEGA